MSGELFFREYVDVFPVGLVARELLYGGARAILRYMTNGVAKLPTLSKLCRERRH